MRLDTLAVHAGHTVDQTTGAVASPITLSTTFERAADGAFPHGFSYIRSGNPNRQSLEQLLAAIEGGGAAVTFATGSAATAAVFQALAPGDHVILPIDVYYGTLALARDMLGAWGLRTTALDMADPAAVRAALRPETRLIWLETPSNPMLTVTDIAAVAAIAHEAGALCLVDNTWATPVLQRPLDLGADLVMHSTTKYMGGHHDVAGGAIVARADDGFTARLRLVQKTYGATLAPFDCWLTARGIQTLPLRVRAQSESALIVARFLAAHPHVERVHYPGLEAHPGHAVAARQMSAWGAMLSVQVPGGEAEAMAVAAKLRVFTRATSLGGVESSIEHRASIEGPGTRAPANLLRLSIGLEHPDDLTEDLVAALG